MGAAHEVTQAEFEAVMGQNPGHHSRNGDGAEKVGDLKTGRFPVEQVSWTDAVEFCEKLSHQPEELSANRVYRLPTESEWEFACRAGSTQAFSTGQIIDGDQANIRADQPYWKRSPQRVAGTNKNGGKLLTESVWSVRHARQRGRMVSGRVQRTTIRASSDQNEYLAGRG